MPIRKHSEAQIIEGLEAGRSVGRTLERDEAAIRRWKKERWPGLKEKPRNTVEPSSLSMKAG